MPIVYPPPSDTSSSSGSSLDTADCFGAIRNGVLNFLPHRVISSSSKPSLDDIDAYLDDVCSQVNLRVFVGIDQLTTLGASDMVAAQQALVFASAARSLIELGAASYAEAGGFPERQTVDQENSSLSALYWTRFTSGLDALATAVDAALAARGLSGANQTAVLPRWAFPDTVGAGRGTTPWESF